MMETNEELTGELTQTEAASVSAQVAAAKALTAIAMRNLIEEAGIFTEEASTGQLTGPATVHALVAIAKALTVIAAAMVESQQRAAR